MSFHDKSTGRLPAVLGGLVLTAVLWPTTPARAAEGAGATDGSEISALRQQIEELDQKLKVLERKQELQQETATAAAATTPVVRANTDRFSLASSNGQTFLRLRAVLNVDNRSFSSSLAPNGSVLAPGSNGFLIRQARPIIEGTLSNFIDFRLMPDFAGGKAIIQDAYITARFKPWFAVTAGKFKSPVGLERLQGDTDTRFTERALPDKLIPNRDLGVQISGDLLRGIVTYQAAWLNGAPDGGSVDGNTSPDTDNNDQKDLAARLFALPFRDSQLFLLRGLGIGVGASFSDQKGTVDGTGAAVQSLLPSYRTNGQQTFLSYRGGTTPTLAWGKRTRVSPQAYYYYGPFGALAEYVTLKQDVRRVNGATTRQDSLEHSAWQLGVQWNVTGEDEGYRAPAPKRPYVVGGPGWGLLELTARIAELKVDANAFTGGANSYVNPVGSASKAKAWTLGVNWGLTQNFKVIADYEQTAFTGGAANNADAPTEKVLFTRFQLQY
jgi:phosphate-selective porin OprO/OprP